MERVGKGRDYRSGRKREIGRFAENLEKQLLHNRERCAIM